MLTKVWSKIKNTFSIVIDSMIEARMKQAEYEVKLRKYRGF